jgi:glutamine amidotransferase PdxT
MTLKGEISSVNRGVDNIRKKIDEINKQVDDNQSGVSFLVLHTYINAFDYVDQSDQSLTPYFIDSPGVEEFRDDVRMFYTTESSLVYIENYTRLTL